MEVGNAKNVFGKLSLVKERVGLSYIELMSGRYEDKDVGREHYGLKKSADVIQDVS